MNQATIDALALRLTTAINNNATLIAQLIAAEPGATPPALDLSGITAAAVALETTNENLATTIAGLAPAASTGQTAPAAS